MDIILVRHGKKVESLPDSETPLAQKGIEQISKLKNQLEQLQIKPEAYFTSKFKRAKQTAEILASGTAIPVFPIDVLTPDTSTSSEHVLNAIIDEAKKQGIVLDQQTTIAIVGHEPQLGQVVAALTSTPVQPVGVGKAVRVQAASLSEFLQGKGKIQEV
ncbi:phosphohistidine phosphatase SixA [Reticulibacter mediterranei]|uniref:Phosphohistidine phosphatase SixA n=1 Tax=Reticulibacter mediterranei TaxID=2778369 RepID=A0A8J3N9X1_9CHLR|nr:histidine phosphatase family protein [Reticulibacter mediterranei]GHP01051.1 phosphohistidine phosphatase SixA [Reticulibacter mediterranei]